MEEKAGLYIHIPFCKNKCPYCNFYSVKYTPAAAEEYVKKLISEMENYTGLEFDTLYFGGGTPSIIGSKLLGEIITAVQKTFTPAPNSEITVECNPSDDLPHLFKDYAAFGVNRVSIGMQSAVREERLALGRTADKDTVLRAVEAARKAGIENISLDLMLGTPKQTMAGLGETLQFIKETTVPHISAYMLKIEEGTPFYKMQPKLALPTEDTVADMYLFMVEELEKMGLMQYEISNFALPGFESKHNIKYWHLVPYLGLGPTAHSFLNGKRFYYDEAFKLQYEGEGGNTDEAIMLGLRMKEGIEKSLIKKDISRYIDMGFMEEREGRVAFTPKGFLVSNTILADILS